MVEAVISKRAIKRRAYWVGEIAKLSGRFGDDSSRLEEELTTEEKKEGADAIIDHLRLCGPIPESYGHDTSEEKLCSKYTDALLAASFRQIGLTATVLTARADAADVEAFAKKYSLVADAKVFRLSRTAKNQKDFKIEAMHGWKRGNPHAMIVCPLERNPMDVRSQGQPYRRFIHREKAEDVTAPCAYRGRWTKIAESSGKTPLRFRLKDSALRAPFLL